MASLSTEILDLAIKGVIERDDDKLHEAIALDSRIDDAEMEIDQMAFSLFSRGPLASDLRLIMIAVKASSDLERIGDEATTISRRGLKLSLEPQLKDYVDIPKMTLITMSMLKDALTAFVTGDSDAAREIVLRDKQVDKFNKDLQKELEEFMSKDPGKISRCLHLMTISKAIERVADHVKNIAEGVVFLHEGEDIRHRAKTQGLKP